MAMLPIRSDGFHSLSNIGLLHIEKGLTGNNQSFFSYRLLDSMKSKVCQFLIIVFAISFISAGLFYVLGGTYQSLIGNVFASLYMFIPMISVVIVQLINKEPVLKDLGVSFKLTRWLFIGWLLMPIFNVLAMFLSTFFPEITYTTDNPILLQTIEQMSAKIPDIDATKVLLMILFSGLASGFTINALFAMGEEIAWRGWLLKQYEGTSFLKTSLLIAVIWGLWHSPLILMGHNYPAHPVAGVFMMVAFCAVLTPLIMYIRIKAHSVVAAAILHGTVNAGAGISAVYLANYNDLLCGSTGLAGIIVLLCIDLILFAFDSWITKERIMTSPLA